MKTLSLLSALVAVVVAVPAQHQQKRDSILVTDYAVTTTTIYSTIWVAADASPIPFANEKKVVDGREFARARSPVPDSGYAVGYNVNDTPGGPMGKGPRDNTIAAPAASSPPSSQQTPIPSESSAIDTAAAAEAASVEPASVDNISSAAAPTATPSAVPTGGAAVTPASGNAGDCNSLLAGSSCSGMGVTHYDVGLGACGIQSNATDFVFAIPLALYTAHNVDGNPNHNPLCGKTISFTTYTGGQVTGTLVDSCPGCSDLSHLDLSDGLWHAVTGHTVGEKDDPGHLYGYTWMWTS